MARAASESDGVNGMSDPFAKLPVRILREVCRALDAPTYQVDGRRLSRVDLLWQIHALLDPPRVRRGKRWHGPNKEG